MKLLVVVAALGFDHAGHTALRVEPLGAVKHVLLERQEEHRVEAERGHRTRAEKVEARSSAGRRSGAKHMVTEHLSAAALAELEAHAGDSGDAMNPKGELRTATSIAVDDRHFLMVAEKDGDMIIGMDVLDPGDPPLKTWPQRDKEGGYNGTNANFTIQPLAIALMMSKYAGLNVDGGETKRANNLYVAEATRMTRWIDGIYDNNFEMQDVFDNPFAMTASRNGRLFISDTGNHRVLQIKMKDFADDMKTEDDTHNLLRGSEWEAPDYTDRWDYHYKEEPDSLLQTGERFDPSSVATWPDASGEWEMHIVVGGDGSTPGSGLDQVEAPTGVAVHLRTHKGPKANSPEKLQLFIADAHHRVIKFRMDMYEKFEAVTKMEEGGVVNETVTHVKWDKVGTVVAGSGLNAAGNCCAPGADRGSLNKPTGLAVKDDWLYIADSGNNRILMWEIGAATSIQIIREVQDPQQIALSSASIIVLDGEGNLRKWNLPCEEPAMTNTKEEECQGYIGLIPPGKTCEPMCSAGFGYVKQENDRLACKGRPLQFACELTGVPADRVTDVAFEDTDPKWRELGGVITWKWPPDIAAIQSLDIYFGPAGDPSKKELLAEVDPRENDHNSSWNFSELGENYRTGEGISFCNSGELRLYARNALGLSTRVAVIPYEDMVEGGWKSLEEDDGFEGQDCQSREGVTATGVSKPTCDETTGTGHDDDGETCFSENDDGKYFFFDKGRMEQKLGYEVEDNQVLRMSLLRNDYKVGTGQIRIFCDTQVAAVGDCRGRLDPAWAAEPHQWRKGDALLPTDFPVQATNKKGCYDAESACCQDGKECWPTAAKYFFFSKAAAEDALGQPIAPYDTARVRQVRDGVGVWKGTVMFACQRPNDDDSRDLWGDCWGRVCAEPLTWEGGQCVEESYIAPDEPIPRWAEGDMVQPMGAGQQLEHRNETHGLHSIVKEEGESDDDANATNATDTSLAALSFVQRLEFGTLRENMRL
jgi:hypothetical protein